MADVAIKNIPWASLTQVCVNGGGLAAWKTVARDAFSLDLPIRVGETTAVQDARLAKIAPDRFWLIHETAHDPLFAVAEKMPAGASVCPLDLTHGRSRFRVSGAKAQMLLMKGTPVDLAPLGAGALVNTGMGHIQVAVLVVETGKTFDVMPARSLARDLWEWLALHEREYGGIIEG